MHLEIQRHRKNPVGILRSSFRDPKDGKIKHKQHGRLTGMAIESMVLVQSALRGDVFLKGDPDATAPKPSALPAGIPPDMDLIQREQAILDLLLKGHLYKEIAAELDISPHTVHFHIRHIYQKLHVRSRAQVVARFPGK